MRSLCIIILCSTSIFLYGVRGQLHSPGPLFAFGQNILTKGETKSDVYLEYGIGDNLSAVLLEQAIVHGITNRLSFEFRLPIFIDQQFFDVSAPGIGNMVFQLEYALFNFKEHDANFEHLMTCFAAFSAPNGNTELRTFVSCPKPVYHFGFTNSIISGRWNSYYGLQAILTQTFNDGQKIGNKLAYDMGIGKALVETEKHFFAIVLEMTGLYSKADIDPTAEVPNFPANIILFGPSFRYQKTGGTSIIQIGFQYPISQPRLPIEEKTDCRVAGAFSWRF